MNIGVTTPKVMKTKGSKNSGVDLSPHDIADPFPQNQPPVPPCGNEIVHVADSQTPIPSDFIASEVCGGEDGLKENPINLQDGDLKGGSLSHVLYENPHIDHRLDSRAPATPGE